MKSLVFGVCLCAIASDVLGHVLDPQLYNQTNKLHERTKRQTQQRNGTFLMELADFALQEMDRYTELGHKLITVEEIGTVSRDSNVNAIKVIACRFNDIIQKEEVEAHPEKTVTLADFNVCESCQFKIFKAQKSKITDTYRMIRRKNAFKMACHPAASDPHVDRSVEASELIHNL